MQPNLFPGLFTSALKISLISSLWSLSLVAYAVPVSNQQIVQWLINPQDTQVSADKIRLEKTEAITIGKTESALISSVQFEEAGRNFWGGYILTRPALRKSMFLNKFGGQANDFKILSRKYQPTLVQLSSAGSGQGDVESSSYVLAFNDWQAKIYYQADSNSIGFGRYTVDDYPANRCEEKNTTYRLNDKKPVPEVFETLRVYQGKCLDSIPAKAYITKHRTIVLKLP